jgi:hypothetical protein
MGADHQGREHRVCSGDAPDDITGFIEVSIDETN